MLGFVFVLIEGKCIGLKVEQSTLGRGKRVEAGKFGGRSWGQGQHLVIFVVLFKSFILMLPFIKASTYVAKSTTKFDAQLSSFHY